MGQFSQVAQPQTNQPPQGKGPISQVMQSPAAQQAQQTDGISRPMGKGGQVTYPGQGGQPAIGQPNRYSNTVGAWDNANIGGSGNQTFQQQPQQPRAGKSGGKGV